MNKVATALLRCNEGTHIQNLKSDTIHNVCHCLFFDKQTTATAAPWAPVPTRGQLLACLWLVSLQKLCTPSSRDSEGVMDSSTTTFYISQIKMRQLYSNANKVPIHKILNSIPFGASVTADDSRKQVESLCSLPAPLRAWDRLLQQVRRKQNGECKIVYRAVMLKLLIRGHIFSFELAKPWELC